MNKTWNIDEIKENLIKDNIWVVRAVVAIYNYQTLDEQEQEETTENNGVGFNGCDGNIMSSFAKQIIRYNNNTSPVKHPSALSPKQMSIARKKIIKYSKQLTKIANGEI